MRERGIGMDVIESAMFCKKCYVPLERGQAMVSTWVGAPDFPGGAVVTLSPGGPGKLVDCLKCPKCGFSRHV